MDERILRAIEIMASHFHEPTSLPRLASRCGLSLSRFAHLFKEQTGITPQRLLEENRLRHAAHLLLSTGLMVFEIASEVGYESPFYFSNRFRRFWGKTPSAFRRAGAAGLNSPKARRS
jgi:AraC family transcriptional regulator of arabinose operon